MRLIAFLLRHSRSAHGARWQIALAIALSVVSGLATSALLATVAAALRASPGRRELLAWAFLGLLVLVPASAFAARVAVVRLTARAVAALQLNLSRSLLAAPLRQLEEAGPASLLAVLGQDVLSLSNALAALPNLALNGALLAGTLGYLGYLSWRVLLLVLALLLPVALVYRALSRRATHEQRFARDAQDVLYRHFRGLIEGQKELKLHRRRESDFLSRLLWTSGLESARRHVATQTLYSAAGSWGQMMFFVIIGLVLFVLPAFFPVDAGAMAAYALAIVYMLIPTDALLNLAPVLSQARIALHKVESLGLSLAAAAEAPGTEAGVAAPLRSLELEDVAVSYRQDGDETFQLGPLRLRLPLQQLIFLTGGNGSGKTTLAKLLVGLYPPAQGEIRRNGEPVPHPEAESYRGDFSAVFSDFHLFSGLLGLERPRLDEEALQYLRLLRLDHKVRVTDGVLSSLDLSQGERKRLALLTAYLEDRAVYVFDEWAADQDPEFKRVFYRRLLPELKARGKTVLVISHDERFYDVADRIVKLDFGQLAFDTASGAHS